MNLFLFMIFQRLLLLRYIDPVEEFEAFLPVIPPMAPNAKRGKFGSTWAPSAQKDFRPQKDSYLNLPEIVT